jgi:hypothetical protein
VNSDFQKLKMKNEGSGGRFGFHFSRFQKSAVEAT